MKSKKYLRIVSQLVFLTLFLFLLYIGNLQLWIVVFIIGVAASIGLGRLYCGWICPMDTLARPINWLKDKLSIGALDVPDIFRSKKLRYSIVLIFFGSLVMLKFLGVQLPFPNVLIITVIGVTFLTVFDEELFHKYLCPYGAILSLSSKPSRYIMKVDKEGCIGCGRCQEVCPPDTIETLDSGKREVTNKECLKCFQCQDVCPADCITYEKKD
ncbi:MAG: 4Fe-4S dicluster-binding protein [Candidatus Thermoplasmatota archaeon]